VVGGGHHRERDERAPQQRERLCPALPQRQRDRYADGDREPDMQARHGGERVVEDRRAAGQPDGGLLADGVGQAEPGKSRGSDREESEHGHGDQPGRDHRVAQTPIELGGAAVEPDQSGRHDRELGGQVEVAQEPARDGPVEGALARPLDCDSRRLLELEDPAGVPACLVELTDEEPAGKGVDEVGGQEQPQLGAPARRRHAGGAGHPPSSRGQLALDDSGEPPLQARDLAPVRKQPAPVQPLLVGHELPQSIEQPRDFQAGACPAASHGLDPGRR
jgi:hypothetical protein